MFIRTSLAKGIFTGKGIYDVAAFHEVLNHRFPRNALLSHDLIEGAYARAGLVSDIEVIDDYPSHYSAHTKRKHRWVRGDWQILRWLFNVVPDEYGNLVTNPISTISRWKILDNLRRSLIEPVTFLLFVFGWFFLPGGAQYWTVTALLLMLLPGLVQLGFNVSRALFRKSFAAAREGMSTFMAALGMTLMNLIFLPHHMLLSLDAIVRSLNRTLFSGRNLLDWETAAQSESGGALGSLDTYLKISPVIALTIAIGLALARPESLFAASPILILWALAPAVISWLNSPPRPEVGPLKEIEQELLERHALLIWRYFAEFGGPENHWLIPDNVEEKDKYQVRKLSPTNLGMLINARQAACEFGFITPAEFAESTLGTLIDTYKRLEKQRGHIYNWYDIETLRPIMHQDCFGGRQRESCGFVLFAVYGGALAMLKRPLIQLNNDESQVQSDGDWESQEMQRCRKRRTQVMVDYAPRLSRRFDLLMHETTEKPVTLARAAEYALELEERLSGQSDAEAQELRSLLPAARDRLAKLRADLQSIAERANGCAEAMEYGFLLVESRKLLSIGYDGVTGELYNACYDLLASEARMAFFLAVAKGDIPQESWFRLDRSHVLVKGRVSPAVVDRHDVRVPDAGAVDAELSEHADHAGTGGSCEDSEEPRAKHAVGHLGVRFCKDGCGWAVWVPGMGYLPNWH